MIWNRSESELQFRIHEINPDLSLSPSSSSDNDFITFYEVDNDEPIRNQIVSIPSFAPKIIQIHLNGQVSNLLRLCLVIKSFRRPLEISKEYILFKMKIRSLMRLKLL